MPAVMATGFEKVAVCQPSVVSLVKVTVASFCPVLDHSVPTWTPRSWVLL